MAWTNPRTWLAQEQVTAALLNTHLRDNLNALPRGILGYAQVTVTQSGVDATVTDITGLLVGVTVGSSRRIRVSAYVTVRDSGSGSITTQVYLREGSTTLGQWQIGNLDALEFASGSPSVVLTPTAGSHTYKVSLSAGSNTVNMIASSGMPAYLLIEDIGPA